MELSKDCFINAKQIIFLKWPTLSLQPTCWPTLNQVSQYYISNAIKTSTVKLSKGYYISTAILP